MAKRYAVIEIGSNSIKLLVAEGDRGTIHPVHERQEITRLSRGMGSESNLQPKPMENNVRMISDFVKAGQAAGASEIITVGTACLRTAGNAVEFIDRVEQETGIRIRVLDGQEEAHYSYLGGTSDGLLFNRHQAVVDIGGGSTEIVTGIGRNFCRAYSLPLGAVVLTERYQLSESLIKNTMSGLQEEIFAKLADIDLGITHPSFLGVGGVITTLVSVNRQMREFRQCLINGFVLSMVEIERQIELYRRMNAEQRRKIPGMIPGREDIILAGVLVLHAVMQRFRVERIAATDRGVRHGILWERLNSHRSKLRESGAEGR